MFDHGHLVSLAMICLSISWPSFVAAQDSVLHFTSSVSNPAPQPGQPFTLTWAGGDPSAPVYIIISYLFPDTPNQDIPYIQTDILSNAPNNGSWVYNVPSTIESGRYAFSIGINPLLLSDTTPSFTIVNPQSSYIAPYPSSTTAGVPFTYNGCGLVPLPDYTYTGYQAPCVVTSDGRVETIYPIVPASLSSSFFGSDGVFKTNTELASAVTEFLTSSSQAITPTATASYNTNFASGIYAQALQCPTSVSPVLASVIDGTTTMFFSSVGCSTGSGSMSASEGICHTSGYSTFSVSGTSSVCCPAGWSTTPLLRDLFCYTSAAVTALVARDTVTAMPNLAYTTVGVVRNDVQAQTASSTATSPSSTKTNSAKRLSVDLSWPGPLMSMFALIFYSLP